MHFLSSEFPQSTPEDALFHIIPMPMEQTVSYGGGTNLGPEAILEASYQLEAHDGTSYPGELGIHTTDAVDCTSSAETCFKNLETACTPVYEAGKIPVTLGGEHSLSIAPVRALHNLRQDFGVVQIDAHADLRDAYEDSPNSHACVMRRIHELGVPIFQIGIRNLCQEEIEYRADQNIAYLDARELARHGIPENLLPADFPKNIYLTFDVDGLDASLMPATGTPEPGGLTWWQALDACEAAAKGRKILGLDVVELAPRPELHSCSYTAAKLTYALMGIAARSRDI
ncbi:agmatinase [Oceaniferula spumae]|uniref:Agmatinase n=1 Tax=Oceaniferula spumae TaxID=2979115 RepID=A0AAT9FKI5_9BACT